MEVRQLRYFVAVAEELHFGRAAERLHVAQPAVSQQVGRLERELGVRLLERTSRRVALTGDGRRLLDEARAALAAVERVRTVAADLSAGRAAVLRVGTAPGVGPRLSRAAARLRTAVPDLTLTLVDGTVAAHISALRAGELDIALVRGEVEARDLQAVEVWREPLQVLLPAAHPAAAAAGIPIAALADLTLRLPDRATDPALHDAAARRVPRRRRRTEHRPAGALHRGRRRRDRDERARRHGRLRLRGRGGSGCRRPAAHAAGRGARPAAHARPPHPPASTRSSPRSRDARYGGAMVITRDLRLAEGATCGSTTPATGTPARLAPRHSADRDVVRAAAQPGPGTGDPARVLRPAGLRRVHAADQAGASARGRRHGGGLLGSAAAAARSSRARHVSRIG